MKTFTTLCTLLALPLASLAATLNPVSNRIDAVTVFLDRAEVTRQLGVELSQGTHTIEVKGLPAQLIEASLRASGEGPKGLRIGSVETRREFGEKAAQEQERRLREQLQLLKDQQAQLEGREQALNTQAAFIERLAAQPSDEGKAGERHFVPEKWPGAWKAIGSGMAETNAARVALKQEQRDLKLKIRKVEEELRQVATGRRDTLTALLHIEADHPGKARFALTYQMPNATWTPGYAAHLTTEQVRLELTQSALVRQSSGEAWEGVILTVSTARPSAGASMPELDPWWIDFPRPVVMTRQRVMKEKPESKPMLRLEEGMSDKSMAEPEPAETQAAAPIVAASEATEFSVRYRIPGRVSVPADNSRQRFVLATQQFSGKLSARTTPKYDPRAFLYALFDYSGEAPLLAGTWQLQRDGVYVGSTNHKAVRPGEELALAFGPDEALKVEYQLLKDERSKQGLISREQRVERHYRIKVSNGHKVAVPVNIYDQLPVARDEAITVELDKDGAKPNKVDVEDRRGVLRWEREIKPGGKAEIDFGYSVSFPQGREVPGF